ncbi:MAG: carboxypeptidase regulatory-like domain-containing protein [Gemmataceae bacterium]|nr:carboxypeptidase regulatory-like domain-containing protein [Planctomycetia bacterium]MBX3397959.1 carboxypeptidase regulatory-like domain-containing protein [Gemmataceae bacterium]
MNRILILAISLALLSGCGEPKVSMSDPVPVTGTVKTADGKPVPNVRVMLLTVNTQAGANGTTDAAGNFKLGTYDNKEGAIPGKYRVQLTPILKGDNTETENSYKTLKTLPPRFLADDSTLEVEVASGKPLDIVIPAK